MPKWLKIRGGRPKVSTTPLELKERSVALGGTARRALRGRAKRELGQHKLQVSFGLGVTGKPSALEDLLGGPWLQVNARRLYRGLDVLHAQGPNVCALATTI